MSRSSNAIADERQGKREDELIDDGWLTTRVSMKRRWSKGKDLFNLFDILAYKNGRTLFSQVTSHETYGYIDKIKQWMKDNWDDLPDDLECEVAVWYPPSKTLPERFVVTTITWSDI